MAIRKFTLPPLALLLLAACSKEEIRSYQVASEESETTIETPATHSGAPRERSVRWQAPESWLEEPAGQFQVAVYRLSSELTTTVSMLPGEAGGVAANVNRWRGQVGLDPLVASEITGADVPGFKGEGEFKLHELLGDSGKGILAGILRLSGETWFFKMSGPVSQLADQRASFLAFLGSVETKAGSGFGEQGPPADEPDEPKKPKIHFVVPEGWTEGEESPMRVATFRVAGEDGYEADIAVVPLPGDSGSALDNVNRWRSQLQLEALDNEGDPAVGEMLDGPSGKYLLCHMKSTEPLIEDKFHGAISAAIMKGNKYTWFLKMSGESRVVEANQSHFEEFVRSVSFP